MSFLYLSNILPQLRLHGSCWNGTEIPYQQQSRQYAVSKSMHGRQCPQLGKPMRMLQSLYCIAKLYMMLCLHRRYNPCVCQGIVITVGMRMKQQNHIEPDLVYVAI